MFENPFKRTAPSEADEKEAAELEADVVEMAQKDSERIADEIELAEIDSESDEDEELPKAA